MTDMVACLIARVIGFFLIDIVNEVQASKLQVYESVNCTNLQPVTLCPVTFSVGSDVLKHKIYYILELKTNISARFYVELGTRNKSILPRISL